MEGRFGIDFEGVRIHTDSSAVQMNRELNAQAFTSGKDIYFGEGRYSTASPSGKKLLAHELTHVIQQGGGKLPTKNRGFEKRIYQQESGHAEEKTNHPIVQSRFSSSVPRIQAYGSDVHEDKTRTLARGVSFSSADADIIAHEDQAVDTGYRHPHRMTPREFINYRISGQDMLHFPSRSVALGDVTRATSSCDIRAFGAALHRLQDSYSHNFTTWSVPAWRIATSYCWALPAALPLPLQPIATATITRALLSNPAYGRWAVLKHACLINYPDQHHGEQRTRDSNMEASTVRYLSRFKSRCRP